MDNLPTKRAAALQSGAPYYFTGKPCKAGHVAKRYASGACVECNLAQSLSWQIEQRERAYANNKKWRDKNVEYLYAKSREWCLANSKRVVYRNSKRRATQLRARPNWLTPAEIAEMKRWYDNRPDGYVVDHIVPMKGKTVCGLDVPWNYQYLTNSENCKKKNKLLEQHANG